MSSPLREILVAFGFEIDKQQEEAILATLDKLKKVAGALGVAFGAHEVISFVKETVHEVAQLGDQIGETAQKIGVNAQALQTLGFIAKDAGASMEDMGTAMRFISKNAVAARDGSKEMQANFAKLGVSVRDSNGHLKTADQLFVELADGFVNVKDPAERTALAMKVLGRSGTQLVPTLLKGSDALRQQAKEAEELGFVMGDDLLDASDKFEQAQEEQQGAVQGLKVAFARELIPVFEKSTRALTKLIVKLRPLAAWLGHALVRAIGAVNRLLKGFAQALSGIWQILTRLGPVFGSLAVGLTALAFWFAVAGKAGVLAGIKTAAAWVIANAPLVLMIALVGIIIAAILLVIEDLVAMGDGAESVSGTMIQGFMDLVDELGSVPAAIWDMLKTSLNFWWQFFGGAKDATGRFAQWFVDVLTTAVKFWEQFFTAIWDAVVARIMKSIDMIRGIVGSITGAASAVGSAFGISGGNVGSSPSSGGAGTNVSTGNTSVDVKVDAAGSGASASDIGGEVAKHVEAVLERRDRDLMQAFVTGG